VISLHFRCPEMVNVAVALGEHMHDRPKACVFLAPRT
jgi:hypothetical protein